MYYADFDDNGTAEPVMSYYIDHKLWPVYSRDDLMQQIPLYNKRYLYYAEYAKAEVKDIFKEKLQTAAHYTAANMKSIVLENTGKTFITHELPVQAQWYPVYSINVADVNHDGKKDIIIAGNQSYSRIKFGAYGCGKGDVLINKGNARFERLSPLTSGLNILGDVRNSLVIKNKIIFGVNNQAPVIYTINQ